MKKRMLTSGIIALSMLILCSCGEEEKMSVKEDFLRMEPKQRYTVKVANAPEEYIEWSSSDESIAVVSPDGTVSAVNNGITTITAMSGEQYVHVGVVVRNEDAYTDKDGNVVRTFDEESDITEITVGASAGGKGDITVKNGDKLQLRAYVVPSNSEDKDRIFWETEDSSVVKVNEKGVIQAVGKGKTTINAYAPNGVKGTLIVRSK